MATADRRRQRPDGPGRALLAPLPLPPPPLPETLPETLPDADRRRLASSRRLTVLHGREYTSLMNWIPNPSSVCR